MEYMKGVVTEGTGTLAASAYYQTAGKTGTARKFSIRGKGYSDRSMSSFIGIAPYESPAVCILVVIDDSEERLTGGQISAPVFSKVVDSILPYMGVKTPKKPMTPLRTVYPGLKDPGRMPDLTGLSLPDTVLALYELKKAHGLEYRIEGAGRVISQIPARGEKLSKGTAIVIRMK
jgi:membrane peptidoglycan carboxypeptidase